MPVAKQYGAAEEELLGGNASLPRCPECGQAVGMCTCGSRRYCLKTRVPPKQVWHGVLQREAGKVSE